MKTLSKNWLRGSLCCMALSASIFATGCQIHEGGQTLPSGYYLTDDIQYFAPGPEFKLSREAAAQKAYQADLEAQRAGR